MSAETRHEQALEIIQAVHGYSTAGGYGVVGQRRLAALTGLSQGQVTAVMPLAVDITAVMYPGYSLQEIKDGAGGSVYAIRESWSTGAMAKAAARARAAATKTRRVLAEIPRNDPNGRAAAALYEALAGMQRPEILDAIFRVGQHPD